MKIHRRAICISEDRPTEEAAIRVALASIRRTNPDFTIVAFLPNASAALRAWISSQPKVDLRLHRPPGEGANSWNVKPHALLTVLGEGYDQVWWLDSDALVRRDLAAAYDESGLGVLLITEEALSAAYADDGRRADAWGFRRGRHFGFNLNRCVLRASNAHVPLLTRWRTLLNSPEYRAAQTLHWKDAPEHLLGDQDVLTALLCADEFSGIPVRVLRRGPDIVQYCGTNCYTLRERLGNLFDGGPRFIHSQGFKPWRQQQDDEHRPWAKRLFADLLSDTSSYCVAAQSYRGAAGDQLEWAAPRTGIGRALRVIGFGRIVLTGLPLAVIGDAHRLFRRFRSWLSGAGTPD
jgi:hypothetical protein